MRQGTIEEHLRAEVARLQTRVTELEQERGRLEAVLQQIPVGVILVDAQSRNVLLYNEQARQLVPEAFVSETELAWGKEGEYFWPVRSDGQRYKPEEEPLMRSLLHGEVVRDEEITLQYNDGRYLVLRDNAAPIYDAEGNIIAAVNIFYDISKQKQVQEKLNDQARILELVNEAVMAFDRDERFTYWNAGAERLYGWKAEEVLGRTAEELIVPVKTEDERANKNKRNVLFEQGKILQGETKTYRKDGGQVWVEYTARAIFDKDGKVSGYLTVNRDIGERKRAEEERKQLVEQVQAERALLRAVLEQMPVGIIIAAYPDGKLLLHNRQAKDTTDKAFGANAEIDFERIGGHYQSFHVDGHEYQPEEVPLLRTLRTGEVVQNEEIRLLYRDGRCVILNCSTAPVYDSEGSQRAAVLVFDDITASKRAEQTLHATNEALLSEIYERMLIEQSLREREEQLRLAMEAANMGSWDWNMETGKLTYHSENTYRLLGLTPETFDNTFEGFLAIVHPEDHGIIENALQRNLHHEGPVETEFRVLWTDESIHWVTSREQVFCDSNGRVTRMIGVTRDTTQSRRGSMEEAFAQGGKMGTLMRTIDWSKTLVGPIETWPQSLRTAISICLASRFPMLILWGPNYIQFYNDAFIPILGAKHPVAMSQRGSECWSEIWETLEPMFSEVCTHGEAIWSQDQLFYPDRNGYVEETYFTFSYSPIRDESARWEVSSTPSGKQPNVS